MEEKNIEKKEEVKSETQEIKRPWQGTTWVWTRIILFVLEVFFLLGFSALIFIGASLDTKESDHGYREESVFFENQDLDYVFIFYLGAFISLVVILFAVLEIFLIIGFFKGWKWSVIVDIVLSSLGVLFNFISLIFSDGLLEAFLSIFVMCLSGFLLYLSISCLKHPFYNQKKVK